MTKKMSRETRNAQSADFYYAIAIATLCDWLKNLAPYCPPIKRKTKISPCIPDFSRALSKLQAIISDDQGLGKCVRCFFFLLYNWYLRFFFFWLTTFYSHRHNLVLLKFTISLRSIPARLSVSHGPR